MAAIERVTLRHVGETHGGRETASAEVEIRWDGLDAGHPFTLKVYLIEQDGDLDHYGVNADGSLHKERRGNSDDMMGEIATRVLRPHVAGWETHVVSRNWDFPSAHEHWMEYRAVATLVPNELVGDTRVSGVLRSTVD
jgi:hypothetical protein